MILTKRRCSIEVRGKTVIKRYTDVNDHHREISIVYPLLAKISHHTPHLILPIMYDSTSIVLPYRGSPLSKVLPDLDLRDTYGVLYQIMYTIQCMSMYSFRHRDLHLSNILAIRKPGYSASYNGTIITCDYFITIIDFDQSVITKSKFSSLFKQVFGKGKQQNKRYTCSSDNGRHDMATFAIRFIQSCHHIEVREYLMTKILSGSYLRALSSLYQINYQSYSLTYTDLNGRDYRFLNTACVEPVDDAIRSLQILCEAKRDVRPGRSYRLASSCDISLIWRSIIPEVHRVGEIPECHMATCVIRS